MKNKLRCLFIALALLAGINQAAAQGTTAFTYQGQLHDGGTNANGVYTMIFALYDSATSGNQIGSTLTTSPTLANGLFSVNLDFGAAAFNGSTRWLDITITIGGTTQDLSPRVQVLPVPYALFANTAFTAYNLSGALAGDQLAGVYSNTVTLNNPGNSLSGDGGGLTNVDAAMLGGLISSNFATLNGLNSSNYVQLAFDPATGSNDLIASKIRFASNVSVLGNTILSSNLDVLGKGRFYGGAQFSSLYSDSNVVFLVGASFWTNADFYGPAQFSADAKFETNVFFEGPVVFATNIFFNGPGQFETNTSFFGTTYFATNVYINGPVEFATNANFFGDSQFHAEAQFATNTFFNGEAQFNEPPLFATNAYFTANVYVGAPNLEWQIGQMQASFGTNSIPNCLSFLNGGMMQMAIAPPGVTVDNQPAGLAVFGSLAVLNGSVEISSGKISMTKGDLRVHNGSFNLENGGVFIGGGLIVTNDVNCGSLAVTGGATVSGTVTAADVYAANLVYSTIVAGNAVAAKSSLSSLNSQDILNQVASLPISTWGSKRDAKTHHVGPMAHDFQAAFGLGKDDQTISLVDETGVALAAIQALNEKLKEKDAQIATLNKRLGDLEQIVKTSTQK